MVAWAAFAIWLFLFTTRTLKRQKVVGLPTMIGSRGKVASLLAPEGLVRIRGELWVAKSASGEIQPGGEVIVAEQERLKLVVRESGTADNLKVTY